MWRTLFNPAWYLRWTDDQCPRTAKACVHLPLHQQGQFPLTAASSCSAELGPLHMCAPRACNLDHHSLVSFVVRSGVIFIAIQILSSVQILINQQQQSSISHWSCSMVRQSQSLDLMFKQGLPSWRHQSRSCVKKQCFVKILVTR